MSGKLHHSDYDPAESFVFTQDNLQQAQAIVNRYPPERQQSAVMPLLTMAQRQNEGWLSKAAMDYIAAMLGMPPVRVYEVASFYTMYNLKPVGAHVVNICTTTPCWLRGSDAIVEACERHMGIRLGETTQDGQITLREVECLGACVNAPMCQVQNAAGEYYYEDLTPDTATQILDTLRSGERPKPGPQSGRKSSEPASGKGSFQPGK